jgi:3',5'-cyclic AMP phosphodiesterase CpdA
MVVVAGDVSYANGMRSCYRRWDEWLATWHKHMKTVEGHLMPILTSIGNHDVGTPRFLPKCSLPQLAHSQA